MEEVFGCRSAARGDGILERVFFGILLQALNKTYRRPTPPWRILSGRYPADRFSKCSVAVNEGLLDRRRGSGDVWEKLWWNLSSVDDV